jgi:hypothetical protein
VRFYKREVNNRLPERFKVETKPGLSATESQ